jgi:ribokinase
VRSDSRAQLISAPKVEAVDKTGAGDAFAGALAVAILQGKAHEEAGRLAVAASAASVTRYGTHASYPDWPQLQRFVASVTIGPAA